MQPPKLATLVALSLLIFSCGQNSDSGTSQPVQPTENTSPTQNENSEPVYIHDTSDCVVEDGKHLAVVQYVNSHTGHNAVYSLYVRVRDCNVDVIYWPSGGWSDSDHITPAELSSEGRATVYGEGGKVYNILLEM